MPLTTLARKVRNRFRQFGWRGFVRYSTMRAIELAHDYAFDFRHGVDTHGATLPTIDGGQGYKASLPRMTREILGRISIRYEDYTFIDLGSGKGRTLLIASEYPFRRVMGVEFVPAFQAIAQANIARYRSARRKCSNVESVCGDVRDFVFPGGPLLVYLYNPFREAFMQAVIDNLRRSLEWCPRPAVVVYLRPLCGGVLEASGFLEKTASHHSRLIENFDYSIYRSTIASRPSELLATPRRRGC